jgi:hypothetical protein
MRRSGVLALLGKPDGDERGAASGLVTERMLFKKADQTAFSVLLAGGLVVDVISGNGKAPGIRRCRLLFRTTPSRLICA